MTVAELMAELEKMPEDKIVSISSYDSLSDSYDIITVKDVMEINDNRVLIS